MTFKEKIEGERRLNAAYRYLAIRWACDPSAPYTYKEWAETTSDGQAASFLAWLCADGLESTSADETLFVFKHGAILKAA